MVKFPKVDIARKDCRFIKKRQLAFCRKKNAVYRQKCTPIWPSKSKHSKSEAIFMFCVVIDLCKKLYLFRTVTFKHGIVYNKNIGSFQGWGNMKPCKKSFDRFRNLLIILSRLCYTFIHSMSHRFVIVFWQLNYTQTIGFMLFLCQLLLNFQGA